MDADKTKTMKKLLITFVLLACVIVPARAQEKPAQKFHEFGIIFSNLDNFGLKYKYGGQKTMLRVSLLSLNLGSNKQWGRDIDSNSIKQRNYGIGFRIGLDHKIPLFSTFSLLIGGELGMNYNNGYYYSESKGASVSERKSWSISPVISFIFGLNYILKDHLVLGAEINPTVSYSYGITKLIQPIEAQVTASNFGFSLATSGAGLYIAYSFGK